MFKNLKNIPNIHFESNNEQILGIDIITIENLQKRTNNLDHNPEKPHQLAFNMLLFFTEGHTEHLVDFVWIDVKKNSILHLSKGQINAFKFNNDVKGIIILFTEDYLKKQLNILPKNEVIRLFKPQLFSPKIQIQESSKISKYIQLLFDEFDNEKQELNRQDIFDSLFSIIFSKLETIQQQQTFYIKESKKLVEIINFKNLLSNHFSDSRNANFYAQKMNITYKHLNNICKEVLNTTAKQFIDEFIILEAKRKLINSTIKSSELSYKLGFEDPTNFIKYFKKFTGLTPNSFKKNFI